MTMEFDPATPIYLQLMRVFRQRIANQTLPAGSRIAAVRELAAEFGVNPNTVQRALSELQKEGLIHAERTSGRRVTTDPDRIARLRQELAEKQIRRFLESMKALGFDREAVIRRLTQKGSDSHDTR